MTALWFMLWFGTPVLIGALIGLTIPLGPDLLDRT